MSDQNKTDEPEDKLESLILSCAMPAEDARKIVMLFLYHRPSKTASFEEIEKVIGWAQDTFIRQALLQNVLDAAMAPTLDEDDDVGFMLTEKGMRQAEELGRKLMAGR